MSALVYLDFVPQVYVQTGILTWGQQLLPELSETLTALAIDAIQYSRQSGPLELIPTSPYKEASLRFREKAGASVLLDYDFRYGYRTADSLTLKEFSLGLRLPTLLDRHLELRDALTYRMNFTSNDALATLGTAYAGESWEASLDGSYGIQAVTQGNVYHPLILGVTYSYFFTRQLYGSLSYELATREQLTINSGFISIGSRFGSGHTTLPETIPPAGNIFPGLGPPLGPPLPGGRL